MLPWMFLDTHVGGHMDTILMGGIAGARSLHLFTLNGCCPTGSRVFVPSSPASSSAWCVWFPRVSVNPSHSLFHFNWFSRCTVWWYHFAVLVCIFLMIHEVEHLFVYVLTDWIWLGYLDFFIDFYELFLYPGYETSVPCMCMCACPHISHKYLLLLCRLPFSSFNGTFWWMEVLNF